MSLDDRLNHENAETLLSRDHWTGYRKKNVLEKSDSDPDIKSYSKWVSLTKDELYYVESTLGQGGGWINIDVGMEIKADTMPTDHPNLQT